MKKTLLALLMQVLALTASLAQGSGDIDFMRGIGKMYAVVFVIAALFIGIVIFLIRLDRKLTKLENQIEENE